jgi:dTDP-4-dehydrorhamnose reductase
VRLLIVGASGFVGRHTARRALALGVPVVGTYATRPAEIDGVDWRRLDITDADAVADLVASVGPTAVVSTAYAASPTLAALGPAANWQPNAVGPVTVARAAVTAGARLVHVSTDALHTGRPELIGDTEPPSPTAPYGAAKAAAELAIATICPEAAMPRLSLVNSDGTDGGELSPRERFMIDLASGRATGVLFTDDVRRPIAVTDVAAALLELALGAEGGGTDASGRHAGPINLAGGDDASFHELGVLVAKRHGLDPGSLVPTTIAASGVSRPGVVRLDIALAASLLNTRLRGIRELLG